VGYTIQNACVSSITRTRSKTQPVGANSSIQFMSRSEFATDQKIAAAVQNIKENNINTETTNY
jgi:hypothetical protein